MSRTECLCPPKTHLLNLNAQWDSIGRWSLGRSLGQEGGVLMKGICALIKEIPESSPVPSAL